ncbi:PREDICTED: uncharacterized protein LOC109593036 [Amphimedon queenslandica]|uniref:Uncharacterized protein n=2 Tax=Amphimedon queenslandica TaxID=400682 RepID=A0AAN0K3D4_AMPQE|nr:PREDICTED: uncharacterized protein LOC109593036 [Amphimedon queenslandica]|eukprot:XP_019863861.1 PREDICTED: uncharacterized protein LOC109593036 [Amphimedon queenslandica]
MKTSYYCLLFLSLALANTVISDEYECSHEDLPKEFFKLSKTHIKDSNKRTKNAGGNAAFNQPIRIFVHYNFTAHDGSLSQPAQDRVRAMMTALTNNFQSILTVRRSPNSILINRQCENETLNDSSKPCFYQCADDARLCGVFDTPTEHLQVSKLIDEVLQ